MTQIQLGRYRHYKGNEYTVLGVARHSETLEELVVYRQEYGDWGLWVRPAAMELLSRVVFRGPESGGVLQDSVGEDSSFENKNDLVMRVESPPASAG